MSNIVKGSGLIYTTGQPNTIPAQGYDSEFAIDVNGNQYAWNRTTSVWDNLGQSIEIATSSVAPTHTPSNFRPRFVVTPDRTLYFHSGSLWGIVGALPSGVISSSAQIGPTGIYSGSGTIPTGTAAQLYNNSPKMQQHFLFNSTSIVGAGQLFGMQQIMPIANYNSIVGFYQNDPAFFIHIENTDSQYKTINTFNTNKVEFSAESPDYTTKVIKLEPNAISIADNKHSIILSDDNLAINIGSKSGVTGSFLISDSRNIPYGVIYNDDYSATFIDRSLVDKGYVDNTAISASLIAGRGGIYNGSGNISGTTVAQLQTNAKLHFKYPSGIIGVNINGEGGNVTILSENSNNYLYVFDDYLNLGSIFPSGQSILSFDKSSETVIFSDNRSVPLGIEYESNYSSTFTSRSLVDKGYVDNNIRKAFTPITVTGEKGSLVASGSFTPSINRIICEGGTYDSITINIENENTGIFYDGQEIEFVGVNALTTSLSFNFSIFYTPSGLDLSQNIGTKIIKFAWCNDFGSWIIVNYIDK